MTTVTTHACKVLCMLSALLAIRVAVVGTMRMYFLLQAHVKLPGPVRHDAYLSQCTSRAEKSNFYYRSFTRGYRVEVKSVTATPDLSDMMQHARGVPRRMLSTCPPEATQTARISTQHLHSCHSSAWMKVQSLLRRPELSITPACDWQFLEYLLSSKNIQRFFSISLSANMTLKHSQAQRSRGSGWFRALGLPQSL